MIKKIKVEQLRPGMFIHDFNCGWMEHPFVRNRAKVKDEKLIEKIAGSGISEVYIDTDKGLDVAEMADGDKAAQQAQTERNGSAGAKPEAAQPVPLKEELARAKKIKEEAKMVVRSIMDEVRFGKEIKTAEVEPIIDKMIDSIFRNQDALLSLGRLKEVDEYTYMHSMSVCVLMISFGRHMGFGYQRLKDVGIGGILHDIGKMRVSQEILVSERHLSGDEYNQMKKHVEYSRAILEQTKGITETAFLVAAQHHERVDGKGYPEGLKGDEISLYGQTAAITDVYDAMTSQRCYQRRYQPTEVLKKLFEWKNHYNRHLVEQFIRCIGIYPVGSLVRLESGLLALVLSHGEEDLLHPVVRVVFDSGKGEYVLPYDVDLSEQLHRDTRDRIACSESPDRWGIETERYL